MPYISKQDRRKYNHLIDHLASILNSRTDNDEISGEFNYVLFRLAKFLCDPKFGGEKKYARIAVVLSAMTEARDEFRRRILVPHENEKITKNGDIEI